MPRSKGIFRDGMFRHVYSHVGLHVCISATSPTVTDSVVDLHHEVQQTFLGFDADTV